MLEQAPHLFDDPAAQRDVVAAHGWATLVTAPGDGPPVVSHLPVIVDPDRPGPAVLSHLARGDAELHELGDHDVVIIVQGPNGYIPATFYEAGPYTPTWDYVVVHLYGRPEVLGAEDTYGVLSDTVDHFEADRPDPFRLSSVAAYAHEIAPGATGFRLTPTRVAAKAKLSQDKPAEIIARVIHALETDPIHGNPVLAEAVRRAAP